MSLSGGVASIAAQPQKDRCLVGTKERMAKEWLKNAAPDGFVLWRGRV